MECNIVAKNAEKYFGQYVATRSFTDKRVISHGSDPVKVFKDAKKRGIKHPVIVFIPQKDVVHIY